MGSDGSEGIAGIGIENAGNAIVGKPGSAGKLGSVGSDGKLGSAGTGIAKPGNAIAGNAQLDNHATVPEAVPVASVAPVCADAEPATDT